MLDATQEELRTIIEQIDNAISFHQHWYEDLHRTMLCQLEHDSADLNDDAHRHCQFGQWLYHSDAGKLRQHPVFESIERNHHKMHSAATALLQNIARDGKASPEHYDRFADALKQMRTELDVVKQELQCQLFNLDHLTGVNNRVGMYNHLSAQHWQVAREQSTNSVAMMDLDHFKLINDRFGHQVGDRVLKQIAQHIRNNLRPGDQLFRYGGEEFLISMSQTDIQHAVVAMERLRHSIEQLDFGEEAGQSIKISTSIGVAAHRPEATVDMVIEWADQALYQAKREGRNRVCLWDVSLEGNSNTVE